MKNKRFIAGANCPKCSEQDKIYTYEDEGKKYRACTRCDFNEEMRFESNKKELDTRVNKVIEEKVEPAQVVRLMDPSKLH